MARRGVVYSLVVLALTGAACGAGDDRAAPDTASTRIAAPTVTTAPSGTAPAVTTPGGTAPAVTVPTTLPAPPWPNEPDWASGAVAFLDAYREALASGDVGEIFPFLGADVNWWSGEPGDRLRVGLRDTVVGLQESSPTDRRPGMFFVAWFDAGDDFVYGFDWVHEAVLPPSACSGDDSCRRLQDVRIEVFADDIELHLVRSHVADLRGLAQVDETDLERIESRYLEIAQRLSSGDPTEAAAMISDRPVIVQTDEGPERTDPRQQFARDVAPLMEALPDAEFTVLTTADLGLSDRLEPAVFFTPREVLMPWYGEDTFGGMGIYKYSPVPGEDLVAAIQWLEQPEGVIQLELSLEPIGAPTLILDLEPPPWPKVPAGSRELTGTVAIRGDAILIYNGSDGHEDLVQWALGRYVEAGLPPPMPKSIAFPPDVSCVLTAGLAIDTGEGADLRLCFDAAELCEGDPCTASTKARSTLLHELGHVWTNQHVDEAGRTAFLDHRGLEQWTAPDRDDSGTEHAAEILAWGLLDEETWPARLPGNDCSQLESAFRVLTGHEPFRTCEG